MDKLGELKYRERFSERDYNIMLERDYHNATYEEIAKKFGFSTIRVQTIYSFSKRKQMALYLQAIEAAEMKMALYLQAIDAVLSNQSDNYESKLVYMGHRFDEHSKAVARQFGGYKNAVAYLEKEYYDILVNFRNGEPPSGHTFQEINPKTHRQATHLMVYRSATLFAVDSEVYEDYSGVSSNCISEVKFFKRGRYFNEGKYFSRIILNETEQFVLREKEAGKSLDKIAEQLGISNALTSATYHDALEVQETMKLSVIRKATGMSRDEILSEYCHEDVIPMRRELHRKYIDQAYESVLSSFEQSAVKG